MEEIKYTHLAFGDVQILRQTDIVRFNLVDRHSDNHLTRLARKHGVQFLWMDRRNLDGHTSAIDLSKYSQQKLKDFFDELLDIEQELYARNKATIKADSKLFIEESKRTLQSLDDSKTIDELMKVSRERLRGQVTAVETGECQYVNGRVTLSSRLPDTPRKGYRKVIAKMGRVFPSN